MDDKIINPFLKPFVPIVKGLGVVLGPDYEVALHDVSNPQCSLVEIANPHVTGRKVGEPMNDLGNYILETATLQDADYVPNYFEIAKNGKRLNASAVCIKDDKGKIVGFLCINYDMTRAEIAESFIKDMIQTRSYDFYSKNNASATETEGFADDLINKYLEEVKKKIGKPLDKTKKNEKMYIISSLDKKGYFQLKGSVEYLADILGNTKYTIYSYLREVKSRYTKE